MSHWQVLIYCMHLIRPYKNIVRLPDASYGSNFPFKIGLSGHSKTVVVHLRNECFVELLGFSRFLVVRLADEIARILPSQISRPDLAQSLLIFTYQFVLTLQNLILALCIYVHSQARSNKGILSRRRLSSGMASLTSL